MDDQVRLLVQGQEMFVFVNDVQRNIFRHQSLIGSGGATISTTSPLRG